MLTLLLLLQDLRSEDPAARERAEAAYTRDWPGSETALRGLSRDKDPEVAGRAGRLLKLLIARDELSPWVLEAAPGVDVHYAANDEEALGVDFDRLDEAVRSTRISELELKSHLLPLAPAALRSARGKREESTRLFKMGQMGIRIAVPRLIELLSDPAEEKRVDGAFGLLFMPDYRALPRLLELAREDGPVGKAAIRTLGQWRAVEGIPVARRALKEPMDLDVRGLAARLLARTRAEGAYDAIVPLLETDKGNGFMLGVTALGELGDERALGRLREELAKAADERFRARIQYAIDLLAGKSFDDLNSLFDVQREEAAKAVLAQGAQPEALAKAILCGRDLRAKGGAHICEEHGELVVLVRASGDVEILPREHRRVARAKAR